MSNAYTRLKSVPSKAPMYQESTSYRHRGYTDASEGLGFPREYDSWSRKNQVAYERGRHQFVGVNRATDGHAPKWDRRKTLAKVLVSKSIDPQIIREFMVRYAPYCDRETA